MYVRNSLWTWLCLFYSVLYLVLCVKYRHDVLYGYVDMNIKQLLKQIADDNNVKIMEIESDKDHIHLLIECNPQHYIPNMVKELKGISVRLLFKKHLWTGHPWNPSYFVATVSENTEEQIRKYIQNQKKK